MRKLISAGNFLANIALMFFIVIIFFNLRATVSGMSFNLLGLTAVILIAVNLFLKPVVSNATNKLLMLIPVGTIFITFFYMWRLAAGSTGQGISSFGFAMPFSFSLIFAGLFAVLAYWQDDEAPQYDDIDDDEDYADENQDEPEQEHYDSDYPDEDDDYEDEKPKKPKKKLFGGKKKKKNKYDDDFDDEDEEEY